MDIWIEVKINNQVGFPGVGDHVTHKQVDHIMQQICYFDNIHVKATV